jgi:flagellin-specific chaperone FliS
MMDTLEEAKKTTRAVAFARECIDRKDWRRAEKALAEAQQLIEHLMHEVGDKQREAMQAPNPDEGDKG